MAGACVGDDAFDEAAAEGVDRNVVASVFMQDETPKDAPGSASKADFFEEEKTRPHGDSFAAWAVVAAGR
jgi:hypothetical protein